MKLMEVLKPYLSLAIVGLLAVNAFTTWTLSRSIDDKLDKLLRAQENIQNTVASSQEQISQMNSNMQDEFDRQASLFSESSSVVSYSAEGLVVTTTLTPKEFNTESKITVTSVSNGLSYPKEAVQNGSEFVASCVVPFCESIDISAAITTGTAIEQEPLPSIPCQTLLAFDIYSHYEYDEKLLYFTVSNPQSAELLNSLKNLTLTVMRNEQAVGAVYPTAIELTELPDSMKGNGNCLAYTADLSPYVTLEGEMQVLPKIQSTTGLTYANDPLFSFTGTAEGMDSYMSGDSWYPPLFHE